MFVIVVLTAVPAPPAVPRGIYLTPPVLPPVPDPQNEDPSDVHADLKLFAEYARPDVLEK